MHFNFFTGLTCLLTVVPLVIPSPVPAPNEPEPDLAEVKRHLTGVAKDNSLFYSGKPGGGSFAKKSMDWRDSKKNGYKILVEMWDDEKWANKWGGKMEKFFDLASKGMAELSSGKVYVMLPSDSKGTEWPKGSYWNDFEWPALQKNTDVSEVIRVNPDNDNQETILGGNTNANAYAPGWCGVHVVQYQKNEGPPGTNGGTNNYRLDVYIYDNDQNEIGRIEKADASPPGGLGVTSKLPYVLIVTPGAVDDDPVTFKYAAQSWAYADVAHHCNFGGYENGNREGDCGFTC